MYIYMYVASTCAHGKSELMMLPRQLHRVQVSPSGSFGPNANRKEEILVAHCEAKAACWLATSLGQVSAVSFNICIVAFLISVVCGRCTQRMQQKLITFCGYFQHIDLNGK